VDRIPVQRAVFPWWAWGLSVATHGTGFAGVGVYLVVASLGAQPPLGQFVANEARTIAISIELPVVSETNIAGEPATVPQASPPKTFGGATEAHIDTKRQGRGGDLKSDQRAMNYADRDDRLSRSRDIRSHLDNEQVQRMKVAKTRASWEDWRATKNPMELAFIATGPGTIQERRPVSNAAPSQGAIASRSSSQVGGLPGGPSIPAGLEVAARFEGADRLGTLRAESGLGLRNAAPGVDHRASAPVATARPLVTQGAPAIPAPEQGRPFDNVDTSQQVAADMQSILHASSFGGSAGQGRGGSGGGGAAGAGGSRGEGTFSRALGQGDGNVFDIFSRDPRLVGYFRGIHGKIHPLWANAFPKSAALEMKQGQVTLEFTVSAGGQVTVHWPPLRPSGIDEFDRNCTDAIRRAGPFAPIPGELGRSTLRIRAPFLASNPIVH
jgi:TonB family protein